MKAYRASRKFSDALVTVVKAVILVVLVCYCISLLFPIVWMVINSLKDEYDYAVDLFGFPTIWKFSNYSTVLRLIRVPVRIGKGIRNVGIGLMVYHSLFRAILTPAVTVFFKACCAYCLAKYTFRGRRFLYRLGIVVMILPIVGALPSALMVHKALGTYNNMYLFLVISPNNIFGMDFLIFYGAFKVLSWEYAEAAFIDGASHYTVMFRIMLPMVLPLCVVYFVLGFLGTWNDYSTPLIWLPSYPNLAYGLYYFQLSTTSGAEGTSSPMILAGYTIVMIPTVILYLLCHKVIIEKFTVGGLKE